MGNFLAVLAVVAFVAFVVKQVRDSNKRKANRPAPTPIERDPYDERRDRR
jgi:hypothetical protein